MKKLQIARATGVALSAAVLTVTGVGYFAGVARALPVAPPGYDYGCERIDWGTFNSGYRTICDGPKGPDGSWERERREWTPAHWYTPYCSYRMWVCPSPYFVGESTQSWTTYRVTDDTVPPGGFMLAPEPAWMPPGTNRIL